MVQCIVKIERDKQAMTYLVIIIEAGLLLKSLISKRQCKDTTGIQHAWK